MDNNKDIATVKKSEELFLEMIGRNGLPDKEQVEALRDLLRFHEHRYYILSQPLIGDKVYDSLFALLAKAETANPDWTTPASPTQRVGGGLNKDFPTVQHWVPMLSLENSYNGADLTDWDRKARELSGEERIRYCIEPKFDGASVSLTYEGDQLVRALTRGNGIEGDDITANIKRIRSVPLSAPFSRYGIQTIEIRGEIMMTKQAFDEYNEGLAAQGLARLANPRNAASGSLRMKDPAEVAKRKLDGFFYHVSYYTALADQKPTPLLSTHSGSLALLWQTGFRSPMNEMKTVEGIEAVIDHIESYEPLRDTLPYEIDGMVIKADSLGLQDKLGMTTHHPRWAIAYKFKARQATAKLLSVEFQVGRTGAVTPVAKLTPVQVGGVTVSSISIHNEEYIVEKNLRIGDQVLIERAGDVIPQIVASLPDLRDGSEQSIVFPARCPSCASPLRKEAEEAVWRCANLGCPAQAVERIIHFASKDAMDIRGFGEANVRKFYGLGWLKDIPGIYKLDFQAISGLEGFGAKSLANLSAAIEASKAQPLHRLVYGLGIRFVGETTAKALAHAVGNLADLANKTIEELQSIEDVGIKVATSIRDFFADPDNQALLAELEALGLKTKADPVANPMEGGALMGRSILFTGTLSRMKRSEAEALAEAQGAKLASGVSSKLDILVAGEEAGSKLEKAKKINTIKILDEKGFFDLLAAAQNIDR